MIMRCAAGRFILTEHPERAPRDVPSVTPEELRTLARSLGTGKALDPVSIKLILESKRVLGGTVVNKEDELNAQPQEQGSADGRMHPVRAQGVRDDRRPAVLLTAQQSACTRSSGAPTGNAGSTQQSQLFS